MDYEKKYKEAIERAKKWRNAPNADKIPTYANRVIEEIFPELKESEDEKIRKEIVDFINRVYERQALIITDEEKDNWITWLEKQEGCEYIKKDWLEHIKQSWYKEGFIDGKYSGGTSKEWTINDAATLKELIDFLENGTAKLQHDLTKYANWLKIQFTPIEKQGEQPRYSIGDVLCDKSCTTLDKDAQSNFEIIDIRNGLYICDKCSFPISQQDEYELVAKKIKQKPDEWSKEDEERIEQICDDLKYGLENFRSGKNVKGLHFEEIIKSNIDWLKSLRPQNHWKPTEAQLASLTIACDRNDRVGFDLTQLLTELKKL